jgi:hypothetical protein
LSSAKTKIRTNKDMILSLLDTHHFETFTKRSKQQSVTPAHCVTVLDIGASQPPLNLNMSKRLIIEVKEAR